MRHGSLFSGIGCIDLSAELMGWENVFNCEIDNACNRNLKYWWPNAKNLGDIKQSDFTIWRGRVDVISGGDPCQPHSQAGKRIGVDDERYLWPEFKRAIKEAGPRWVFNENVAGSISNGVLDQKIDDLESLGYSWWPPIIIPASSVGAWHTRKRVFLIAHSERGIKSREKSCSWEIGRVGREFKPVSWEGGWEAAIAKFRGVDDGITRRVYQTDGIRNGIVPQIVLEIFKAIEEYEAPAFRYRSFTSL